MRQWCWAMVALVGSAVVLACTGGPSSMSLELTVERWRREGTTDVFHYAEGRNMPLGFQLLEDAKQYEDYPDVRQPCLIVHGIHDDVVPPRYSEEFAKGRCNVELHRVNSGHELTDALDLMGALVESFLV